ncbi:Asp/Glu racemase [Devosia geojensis]|uniref:Asp/Glu racemase n=1 Tax=Devosia geojensis TaxID=443610 RepID=A0A0F5FTS9_9HYPH|nr:aspartate/glutamate racemase family protein [Devosia geojensis]KKB12228.1 Asp/Glu racemase [Devosia geojensis]
MDRANHPMTSRRLLVINPNTNAAMTERVRRAAEACAPAGTALDVVNPKLGPFAIETPQDRAAAVPHVLELIGRAAGAYDGFILACFDDIAIAEARLALAAPVISMAEAGIRAAAVRHANFDVVTTVEAAVPTIAALVQTYGMSGRCSVRATGIGVSETAAMTERAEAALAAMVEASRASGSGAVVLGSGAYAGRRQQLTQAFAIPFIDGLEAALDYCETAAFN